MLAACMLTLAACATSTNPSATPGNGNPARSDRATAAPAGNPNPFAADDRSEWSKLAIAPYTPSTEAIGDERDIADKRVSHGLVPIPSLSRYATQVLAKLKAASGIRNVPGKVLIVANDQLDAGSTPDGNIFVSLGYFRSLDNEDQLAALLAHELSHVLLHHHDSNWFSRQQKQFMSWFEDAAVIKNLFDTVMDGIDNRSGNKPKTASSKTVKTQAAAKPVVPKASTAARPGLPASTGPNTQDALLTPKQREALDRMNLLVKLNDRALTPAWGRRQESQADRLAADLMMRANYSVADGILPWLAKVAEWDAWQEKVRAELAEKRKQAIETLASAGQFDASVRTAIDGAMKDLFEQVGQSHDDGQKRLDDETDYLMRVYGDKLGNQKATVAPYQAVMKQGEVKAMLDGYHEAFVARTQILDQQYAQAAPALRKLTEGGRATSNHALPNFLLFEAERGLNGSPARLEPSLQRSLGASEPTWEPFESAIDWYGARKRTSTIPELGRRALARFNDAPSAYPRLIALYVRYGFMDEANKVDSDCRRKQAAMRSACDKALKP
ncbi:hypothetical protein BH10PSE17_BH10PSE17_32770 [soil metagenome]